MIVLAARFMCELAALAALAWWGAGAGGVLAAIALPGAAALMWGTVVAPRAKHRLRDPLRFVAESLVWSGAIAALVARHQLALAVGFGVVAFGTAFAARRFEPEVTPAG